jgi:hypothetical protein
VRVDGANHAPANVVAEAAAADSETAPAVIRMAQLAVSANAPMAPYMLDYQRGPRIIHVPQPGEGAQERNSDRAVKRPAARASVERRPEPAVTEDDNDDDDVDDVAPAPPPPRSRAPAPKPRAAAAPPQPPAAITPRWKLRSETPPPPPPTGPRRAVLSAPPPNTLGPTPIRPTPNFDTKAADRNEKFAAPREPAASPPVAVTESQPPLGYSPPATPATPATPEPPATDVTSAAPSAEPSPEN